MSDESPMTILCLASYFKGMTFLSAAKKAGARVILAEFIKGEDGRYYFLEVAARVGGANIEQLVEAASGINLWAEWGNLEVAFSRGETYSAPKDSGNYAGVLICLARQEAPDLSGYQDPEIVYRLDKRQHAGLIVASPARSRVESLISEYSVRFGQDFLAVAPPLDKPPN